MYRKPRKMITNTTTKATSEKMLHVLILLPNRNRVAMHTKALKKKPLDQTSDS